MVLKEWNRFWNETSFQDEKPKSSSQSSVIWTRDASNVFFQWICLCNNIDTGTSNAAPNNAFACLWSEALRTLLSFENHKAAKPKQGLGVPSPTSRPCNSSKGCGYDPHLTYIQYSDSYGTQEWKKNHKAPWMLVAGPSSTEKFVFQYSTGQQAKLKP